MADGDDDGDHVVPINQTLRSKLPCKSEARTEMPQDLREWPETP